MNRRELLKLWKERDRRYSIPRRDKLGEQDAANIRDFRMREVALLEKEDDRDVAMAILSQWRLPLSVTI